MIHRLLRLTETNKESLSGKNHSDHYEIERESDYRTKDYQSRAPICEEMKANIRLSTFPACSPSGRTSTTPRTSSCSTSVSPTPRAFGWPAFRPVKRITSTSPSRSFFSGYFSISGYVFCSSPTLIYVSGAIGLGRWESTTKYADNNLKQGKTLVPCRYYVRGEGGVTA